MIRSTNSHAGFLTACFAALAVITAPFAGRVSCCCAAVAAEQSNAAAGQLSISCSSTFLSDHKTPGCCAAGGGNAKAAHGCADSDSGTDLEPGCGCLGKCGEMIAVLPSVAPLSEPPQLRLAAESALVELPWTLSESSLLLLPPDVVPATTLSAQARCALLCRWLN